MITEIEKQQLKVSPDTYSSHVRVHQKEYCQKNDDVVDVKMLDKTESLLPLKSSAAAP